MHKHRLIALVRAAAIAIPFILAGAGSVSGAHTASADSGAAVRVYVNDNTAGINTIAGFSDSNGTLTPLPGSPFVAGGAGSGVDIGSQGALQLSSDGRYLLAADAGSNQLSVLRILPDGTLRSVEGSPVSSNGIEPVSIAVHDNLVYVANAGNGGSNYTGFTLNPGGHLTPLAGSTVALPDGSGPGDVLFNATGTLLAGMRVNTSLIDSFTVGDDGRLTAAPSSPIPAQATGPFGSEFRPTNASQLFVSNAHAGPNNGSVSAFTVASNGNLTSIGASPFADQQTAPCWVEITADGRYLFADNTGSSSISRYAVASDGTLTLLGSTVLNDAKGLGSEDVRLGPTGRFLYVVDGGRDAVSVLAVQGGSLTELASSPTALPAGGAPFGIVVR
jgi:6-phosphogluconolactonase